MQFLHNISSNQVNLCILSKDMYFMLCCPDSPPNSNNSDNCRDSYDHCYGFKIKYIEKLSYVGQCGPDRRVEMSNS